MTMVHKKDWGPGYIYYDCHISEGGCGNGWKEKTRDCTSLSRSDCPICYETGYITKREPHYEWPTDQSGNLIEEIK